MSSEFDVKEHINSLKKKLQERLNLESTVERYIKLFPTRLEEYQSIYSLDKYNTAFCLYMADYLLTSTELPGIEKEERINNIFSLMITGNNKAKIDYETQITLVELCQKLLQKIINHVKYQYNKGIPFAIIKVQIIDTWLREFFSMLGEFLPDSDIRWILTILICLYNKRIPFQIYENLQQELDINSFNPYTNYFIGDYLVDKLDLTQEINQDDYVSKTAYNIQMKNQMGFLLFKENDKIRIGHHGFDLKTDEKINQVISALFSNIPVTEGERSQVTLNYYHSYISLLPVETRKNLFLCHEERDQCQIALVIITSSIEDVDYTFLKNLLKRHLYDACYYTQHYPQQLEEKFNDWIQRALIAQLFQGAETFRSSFDTQRSKEWELDALIKARKMEGYENISFYSKLLDRNKIEELIKKLVTFNKFIHQLIDTGKDIVPDDSAFEILPSEVFLENEPEEDAKLTLFNISKNQMAGIVFQALHKMAERYIHRKSNTMSRKLALSKVRLLNNKQTVDFEDWIIKNLNFKKLEHEYATHSATMNLREELAGKKEKKQQEAIITSVSVSSRLQEIEKKKNIQLEIQKLIFNYICETMLSNMKIDILEDPKMHEFFTPEYRQEVMINAKREIEHILSKYNVRSLPDRLGFRLQEVVESIDKYFNQELKEGLFKLQSIERDLTRLSLKELQEIKEKMANQETNQM